MHYMTIDQIKSALDSGPLAWPGGYPIYFITSDGAALSFEAVQREWHNVENAVVNDIDDGWRVIGSEINWDDNSLFCENTGEPIPCAYPDD